MPESLGPAVNNPRPSEKLPSPPFVPEDEIKPGSSLDMTSHSHPDGVDEADLVARLMDTGPKEGESLEGYRERMRIYRAGLQADDRDHPHYPPSEVPGASH